MRCVHVSQGKGQKYLAFLTALMFHDWDRCKKLALRQRTELQAALVRTITKEMQPGKNNINKKKKENISLYA